MDSLIYAINPSAKYIFIFTLGECALAKDIKLLVS
jgi:hypothetical protein